MIVFLTVCYIAVLAVLIKLKVVPLNTFTKISPVIFNLLLFVGLFIPMQFAAPSGPVIAGRHVVQIVPLVAGRVTEVAVEGYQPIKQGDLLFRMDDTPYRAAVAAIDAQLTLAKRRFDQASVLAKSQAGSRYELEAAETQVENLEAQLAAAQFNLDNTSVYAPSNGHVTSSRIARRFDANGGAVHAGNGFCRRFGHHHYGPDTADQSSPCGSRPEC